MTHSLSSVGGADIRWSEWPLQYRRPHMTGSFTQHNVTTTITSFVHYHFHYVITAKNTRISQYLLDQREMLKGIKAILWNMQIDRNLYFNISWTKGDFCTILSLIHRQFPFEQKKMSASD